MAIILIKNETSPPVIPCEAKSRIECGTNFEPRFDRFGKLTAGRLTVLLALSGVEGSEVEGGSRGFLNFGLLPASGGWISDFVL